MANISVTTSSNYDSAANLGLLNGETVTITNDAVFTINSDVRWGQNAAVCGDITVTQGELVIDGSQTWWIPFDGGTGTIPSLGTVGTPDVTRGGGNVGEFLGVFTSLGVAPSSGAMPATGFLKLRNKSTTFSDNDVLTLTGGATVTVNSTTGGQRGWIHFVGIEAINSTTGRATAPRLGKITMTGDWFVLGTSNGTSGQTFQHYVADYVPAVQVETGNGTNVWEWWGNAIAAEFTATFLSTDERGRFFTSSSAGVLTFGGATFGKLPPNGARIRVPNVHISTSNSTNWALNILPASITNRYTFLSTGGNIDAQYICSMGSFGSANAPLFQVKYSCGADGCWVDNSTNASVTGVNQIRFDTVASGRMVATNNLQFGASYATDIILNNCWGFQTSGGGTATGAFNFSNCTGVKFTSCGTINAKSVSSWVVDYSSDVILEDCVFVGGINTASGMSMTGSSAIAIKNIKFSSKTVDTQTALTFGINFTNCTNVLVDGLTLFAGTSVPIQNIVTASSQTSNIRIRNIGTRGSPIAAGSAMRYLVSLTNCKNGYLSKIYQSGGSQAVDCPYIVASSDEIFASDCGDPTGYTAMSLVQSSSTAMTNTSLFKRISSGGSKVLQASAGNGATPFTFTTYGTHFFEQEVSSTEVWLSVACGVEKSLSSWSTSVYTDDVGTILRDGTNGLMLRTLNDQVTWTWSYWIRGLTAFANVAPTISGTNTGNFLIQYDLDKGTGFSGTFKTLSAANLSAETGISATGVKVKIRAKCTTANSANLLKMVTFTGTTSSTDITNNPYPSNEPPVLVTGGLTGTTAAVFKNSNGALLDARTDTDLIKCYPEWFSDTACTLRVRKAGYQPIEATFTLTESGLSYPVSQVDYTTVADTDLGALGITVTNHGASPVTWNSKQFSITITVSDSSTAAQIAQYISYHASSTDRVLGSLVGISWPEMIIPVGSSFETQRGTLMGSAGASLKGVRVVDGSGNAIAGFTRMQADDGTYYQPPVSASFILTNLKTNTEVRVYKQSDMSELAGVENVVSGTFTYTYTWSVDVPVIVSIVSVGYQNLQLSSTLTSSGTSIPISQIIDRQYSNP